jgi:hypothetical protein
MLGAALTSHSAHAGDALWVGDPASSNVAAVWNTNTNWSPSVVPDGTATFGASNQTAISFSQATTSIGRIEFNGAAPAYTFTIAQQPDGTEQRYRTA